MIASVEGRKRCVLVALICIYLMIYRGHFHVWVGHVHISLEQRSVQILCSFLSCVVRFFDDCIVEALYIFWISVLYDTYRLKIFSIICDLSFNFHVVY